MESDGQMPRRSKRIVHGVMSATETPTWYGVVEFIGLVDARASDEDESETNPDKKKMQKKLNDLILLMILFFLCSKFTAIKIRT